jgi:hypothetical protein
MKILGLQAGKRSGAFVLHWEGIHPFWNLGGSSHQEMDLIPGGGPNSIGASPRNNFHTVSILVNEKVPWG